ncbi:MAG: hypothetical protein ACK5NK_09660 [Niabella sp.]
MKGAYLLYLILLCSITTTAQRTKDAMLEDSVFAWKPMQGLVPSKYPWAISPAQQKLPALFFEWIKKSHPLVGAVNKSYALAEPNNKDEASSYAVGVNAAVWRAIWDNTGKVVKNQPHSETPIQMLTNYLIDATPISLLSIPGRPVFFRRSQNPEETFADWGYGSRLINQFQLEKHPQLEKYIVQYYGCVGEGCQPMVAVYLAPNNKLPIRQLTRGEVLNMCEAAIPGEIKRLLGDPITVNNNYLKEKYAAREKELKINQAPKWKTNIEKLRKQYASSLDELAFIRNINGIQMSDFENGNDIFEITTSRKFGVYTYEDGVMENSKKDKPLWICINWMPANENTMLYAREVHRSMTTHFNFDYVYNYFFNADKVKGQPYAIRNPEEFRQTASRIKSKAPVKANTSNLSAGVYFADDFSSNSLGNKPNGWFMPSVGKQSLVVQPNGLEGNWVDMGQHRITPLGLKNNLPENFKIEFDVACNDFEDNQGATLKLQINNNEITANGDYRNAANYVNINFDITPSNAKWQNNPTGSIRLNAEYKGMDNKIRYAGNPMKLKYNEFSNKKNKAHITIVKKGNKIGCFINGRELESQAKDKYGNSIPGFNELPAGARFTTFYFEKSADSRTIFISNIKVSKLD